jgi:ubiquinone/menaquinone biosynthesis C-methylase UbiE
VDDKAVEFFREDPRVLFAPPTECATFAATEFERRAVSTVLDLGRGMGRDSRLLTDAGFSVTRVDAAQSGLEIARQIRGERAPAVQFIKADARRLPFADSSFDAVYCFGLLHEFTGERRDADVAAVMREIRRALRPDGLLVLAVLAGDPSEGLPQVWLFSEEMFDEVIAAFRTIEKCRVRDVGCTGSPDYVIWRGFFRV